MADQVLEGFRTYAPGIEAALAPVAAPAPEATVSLNYQPSTAWKPSGESIGRGLGTGALSMGEAPTFDTTPQEPSPQEPEHLNHPEVIDLARRTAEAYAHPQPTPEMMALRSKIEELYKHADAIRSGALSLDVPTPHGPSTKELIIGGLLGMFGGNSALGNLIGGYQQGRGEAGQLANQQFQQKQQSGLLASQAEEAQAGRLEKNADDAQRQSNTDRAFFQNQENIETTKADQRSREKFNEEYKNLQLDANNKKAIELDQSRLRDDIAAQQRIYANPKNEGAHKAALRSWRNMEAKLQRADPDYVPSAPSDDEANAYFSEVKAGRIATVAAGLQKEYDAQTSKFGIIPPDKAKEYEEMRNRRAVLAGIDPKDLPPVPTGETLRKQAQTQAMERFNKTFNRLTLNQKQNLSVAQGRLEVARQMVEISKANGDVNAARLAEQEWNDAVRANKNVAGGLIASLDPKIIKARAEFESLKSNGATETQKRTAQKTLDGLVAEKAALLTQGMQTIDTPFGTMQNPNYKPSATLPPQPHYDRMAPLPGGATVFGISGNDSWEKNEIAQVQQRLQAGTLDPSKARGILSQRIKDHRAGRL